MSKPNRVSRRTALKLGAAGAALPLVHIRTGHAAGKLSVGFWDHWVPAGSEVLGKQCQAWADKNQVYVKVDFITSVGNKLLLTQAAEAQAGTGHDALHFSQWEIHHHADKLVPVDDVVQRLTAKYGRRPRWPSTWHVQKGTGSRCHRAGVRSRSRPARASAC